jgi:hypothetical protein
MEERNPHSICQTVPKSSATTRTYVERDLSRRLSIRAGESGLRADGRSSRRRASCKVAERRRERQSSRGGSGFESRRSASRCNTDDSVHRVIEQLDTVRNVFARLEHHPLGRGIASWFAFLELYQMMPPASATTMAAATRLFRRNTAKAVVTFRSQSSPVVEGIALRVGHGAPPLPSEQYERVRTNCPALDALSRVASGAAVCCRRSRQLGRREIRDRADHRR